MKRLMGEALLELGGWICEHGLRLTGEPYMLVRTREFAERGRRAREQLEKALRDAQGRCNCPKCKSEREGAAAAN